MELADKERKKAAESLERSLSKLLKTNSYKTCKTAVFRDVACLVISIFHPQFSRLLATFDTQQDDLIFEVRITFNEENKFLHCQLTKLIGTLYKAVGKISPTDVLTTTVGHQVMGSSLGGLMSRAA
ncbi:unnamed protein product [Clavelina lepadiformis]|uniref:Uncharacterized protein n=1 Tax=Clavelina lepadiformis TaxID=159417 RepID=A0ABP0FB61_CLALP